MAIKLRAWRIVETIVALMIIGFFMLASYVRRSVATCWVSAAPASASAGRSSWYNFRTDMARAPLGLPGDGSIQGGPSDGRSISARWWNAHDQERSAVQCWSN